ITVLLPLPPGEWAWVWGKTFSPPPAGVKKKINVKKKKRIKFCAREICPLGYKKKNHAPKRAPSLYSVWPDD
ncbi:hypothetical protein, partial [Enterobacter hormaechei]